MEWLPEDFPTGTNPLIDAISIILNGFHGLEKKPGASARHWWLSWFVALKWWKCHGMNYCTTITGW